jgi:hypothetical protein
MVTGTGHQPGAVGGEEDAVDLTTMPVELHERVPVGEVPEVEIIPTIGNHPLSIWREEDAVAAEHVIITT